MIDGKYAVALIGYGGMGHWHTQLLKDFDKIFLYSIFDTDAEKTAEAEQNGYKTYQSFEEVLSDDKVDVLLLAVPNDWHKPYAVQAMKAGKNVISEKPVTLSSTDLQEMIDAANENGKLFTVHQNRRWDEDFLTVKNIMAEGKLGEIFRIESRVHGSRGIPGDWRQEKEHGGGMVLDWGVHLLDQALLLYPGVKLNTVYATLTNVTNQLVDDGFSADLGFENGVHVLVEVGTSNFVSLPRWYVLGADGTAVIQDFGRDGKMVCATGVNEGDVVPVITAAGLTKTMAPRREDTIRTEDLPWADSDIRDFYRNVMAVIEGKAESRIKLDEVARVMRLMEAIFESAEKKQVIKFEA